MTSTILLNVRSAASGGGSRAVASSSGLDSRQLWGGSRLSLATLLVVLAALAVGANPAHAGKGVIETFGQQGTGAGEFAFPTGIAVNQGTGDVYVADADCCDFATGGHRVLQFAADGTFTRAWGWGVATGAEQLEVCTASCLRAVQGSGDGQFSLGLEPTPPGIAVDQADGSVYVADNLNDRVQKFSGAGEFLGKFGTPGEGDGELSRPVGVAVDPGSGDVYVADAGNNRVQRFASSGAFLGQVGVPGTGEGELSTPTSVAMDSTDLLYVLDSGNGRIQRFTSAGAFVDVFAEGSISAPTDLAVDGSNDHVYVAGFDPDFTIPGIYELAADEAAVDVHAPGAGLQGLPGGMAIRTATGRIYASNPFNPTAVAIVDDVDAPTVSIEPVSDVGPDHATFVGAVNPHGPPSTRYRFEYSQDGVTWTSVPDGVGSSIGSGTADVAVSETATDLEPKTEYRVRLVASKDFNPALTATSAELTFTTAATAPAVRTLAAGSRTDIAAWLGGEVNPRNSSTSYHVEYALIGDVEYENGHRVPAADVEVGSDNGFVTVAQLATGLQPGTAYRFRVVASSEAGVTVGPDRTFTTRAPSSLPPDRRGYEMVSPLDKNGGDIDRDLLGGVVTSGAAASGEAVTYVSGAQFGEMASGASIGQYLSTRNAVTGWSTYSINPPVEPQPGLDVLSTGMPWFSEDLSKSVVETNASLTPGAAGLLGNSNGLYVQDNSQPGGANYRLLTDPASPLPPQALPPFGLASRFEFVAASADMRHIVFESSGRQLTPDGLPPETGLDLYEWVDGEVRHVGKLPDGEPAANPRGGSGVTGGTTWPGDNVISEDGGRVYFTDNASGLGSLYVREQGTTTRVVSGSERSGDDPTVGRIGRFMAAKPGDGALALFTSFEQLTDDSTASGAKADLYMWDATAPVGERLTDLSTGELGGADVLGIAGTARDMSRVYFIALGDLATGATAGRPNLYAWSPSGGARWVATLNDQDGAVWGLSRTDAETRYRAARTSDDGDRLLFASRARLTPDGSEGTQQVYVYDFSDDRLTCLSCPSDAEIPQPAWLFLRPGGAGSQSTLYSPLRLPRNLSADGERAYFETDAALVAEDTNGRSDVYEWADGDVRLISSGQGPGAQFVDASANGRDVFFTTRERLVGWDTDDQVDIYDARIDGGFPKQQLPPECVGDVCQGRPSDQPSLAAPGSASINENGNVSKGIKSTISGISKLSSSARTTLATGGKTRLRLRVSRSGTVSLTGRAKIGSRSRRVVFASARARGAGTVSIPFALSRRARAELRRKGSLTVVLTIRFRDARVKKILLPLKVAAVRKGGGS